MAHARRGEVRGELAVDAVAQPDQDPGREPRLGLGQDARQRRRSVPAHGFQDCGGFDGSRFEVEVVCADRAGHAGPLEVRAVWRIRARLGPSVDRDPLAGHDDRVAGERGGESDGACAALGELDRGHLVAFARRAGGDDHGVPRPIAIRQRDGINRRRREDSKADGQGRGRAQDCGRGRHMTMAETAGHRADDHQHHRRGHRETTREDP